jgi:hypothetical protein
MASGPQTLMVVLGILLFAAVVLMGLIVLRLASIQREIESTRKQIGTMDWGVMLLKGVQQLKEIVTALDQIDKRLQKLEAIEKVQLSHINVRAGR